jgi:sugar phosphate isomerase/epimerase
VNAPHDFYTVGEIRSRLSMSTVVFWKYRPIGEATLSALARHGIQRIELLESPEQFDMTDLRSMRYVDDACRAFGIRIVAYHAHMTHFSDLDGEAKRQARVDRCKRQIDTLLALGGNVWGTHATTTDRTLLQCYAELARHVEGTGAVVLIENFKDDGLWVEDRVAFLDEVGHPQAGMILDIGHVRDRDGINPLTIPGGPGRVIALCRGHLRHVHLHGFKDGVDHYPAFAEGDTIRWVELFRALRAAGYGGHINFESKGEPKHLDTIEATALAPERIVAAEASTRESETRQGVGTPPGR